MEKSKRNISPAGRAAALGAAASLLVSVPFNSEPVSADTSDVTVSVTGPNCVDGKNTFNFEIDSTNAIGTNTVTTELNGNTVNSLSVVPGGHFVGHFVTSLAMGENYKIQNYVNSVPVGQEMEGMGLDCEIKKVSPITPIFNDRSGGNSDSVVIPSQAGVDYRLNDAPIVAGEHAVQGKVVISALPLDGFVFDVGSTSYWEYDFNNLITDLDSMLPFTPPIKPADHPFVKLPAKNKKKCKKLITTKNIPLFNPYSKKSRKITKTENKFLKNKCKVKYPKILGSTQNTRRYMGEPYNWSEKPYDIIYKKNQRLAGIDKILNYDGQGGMGYYSDTRYYMPNDKRKTYQINEPIPGQRNSKIDTAVRIYSENSYNEPIIITAGIRTLGSNPREIVSGRFIIEPGGAMLIDLQDTNRTLANNEESLNSNPNTDYEILKPILENESWIKRLNKATVYYAVSNQAGNILEYSQRGILLNSRPKGNQPKDDQYLD
jgi:hypothetical protein